MDRRKTYDALQRLRIPGFSEINLFDALVDAEERMSGIEGRKAIVLIASGIDTFSKLTFDKARKAIQEGGVPIYALGTMQTIREIIDSRGGMGAIQRMDFLQGDNQLRTFTKETGGQAFFPRFYGEFPSIFQSIAQALRNQYSIAYAPTNAARDGKFRKIKVELVSPTGEHNASPTRRASPSSTPFTQKPATMHRGKSNKVKLSKLLYYNLMRSR